MNLTNWSQEALTRRENALEEALLALDTDDGPVARALLAEINQIEAEFDRRAALRFPTWDQVFTEVTGAMLDGEQAAEAG